jgi:AraC family transcriptional regulator
MSNNNREHMQRQEYIARINRVIDYIEQNLDGDLSLEKLANVASFSRFHFHRIFRAMLNETLSRFIQRVRIEKAAMQLTSNPRKSITAIALDTGFSGSASFARAFKDVFAMSASEFRAAGKDACSKMGKTKSNLGQTVGNHSKDIIESSFYIDDQTHNPNWRIQMKAKPEMHVQVKEMPELNVAYVRHIGPYKGDGALFGELFGKLMTWAGPRGLIKPPETQVLSVYHDDPKITEADKLRVSACITVPPENFRRCVVKGSK